MYSLINADNAPFDCLSTLDPFCYRSHPNHRITKDCGILYTATEMEGNNYLCGRHHLDPIELANHWFWGGVIWNPEFIWGLLFNYW